MPEPPVNKTSWHVDRVKVFSYGYVDLAMHIQNKYLLVFTESTAKNGLKAISEACALAGAISSDASLLYRQNQPAQHFVSRYNAVLAAWRIIRES